MIDKKRLRTALFAVCVILFAVLSAFCITLEKSFCMGVRIKDESKIVSSLSYSREDLSDVIFFGDCPAAVDIETDTIYIPQPIKENSFYTEFDKKLVSANENIALYFAKEEAFDNIFEAMGKGHNFSLYAVSKESYMRYNVVFTNLPVVNMTGEVIGQNEDERDVFKGGIYIWNPNFKTTGKYSVINSDAQWHYRGNSNYYVKKKSIKIGLKDAEGQNRDLDLLGNDYKDDDWILNAMYMDDTFIREKLVMDMWNTLCESTDYNYIMSTGEYVELVRDGKYQGLYLLQNRVDEKYLGLEDNQVLVKGTQGHDSPDMKNHYSIIHSVYEDEMVWDAMEGIFNCDNGEYIQLDNWIDISLFIQLGYMTDNSNRYNAFYIIDDIEQTPIIKMILWDTDLALGIGWIDGVFTRSLEVATTKQRYRKEDQSLREIYPELDNKIAARYAQLRKSIFKEEYILANTEKLNEAITQSGAVERNSHLWGCRCNGEDTMEYLCQYIKARLEYLDKLYGK